MKKNYGLKKILCVVLCLFMVFTMLQSSMLSASAKVVGPDNKTELTITADKSSYSWGNTIFFTVDVKNITNETLRGIKINSISREVTQIAQQGELPVISELKPGETKTVQIEYYATRLASFLIIFMPLFWAFNPVGKIAYREANFNYEQKVRIGLFKHKVGFKVEYNVTESKEYIDTDGDGLTDDEEDYFQTDKELKDTDGDTFSDYEEILLGTDPLKPNAVGNSLDTDSDGLTDIDEIRNHMTDPMNPDSDFDELSDWDEIYKYKTDPNLEDTDGDGLRDGFEVKHGLNPLKESTDGKRNDNEVIIEQQIDESRISAELQIDNVAPPRISGFTTGELAKNVSMSASNESTLQDNRAIVGMPVYIDGEDDYINGLTLSFDLSSFSGDSDALTIVRVNEDGDFELVDSTTSGNNISCELYGGGDYCLIDIGKFLSELGIDLPTVKTKKASALKAATTGSGIRGQADIVFAIDTTGSMSGTINNVINNVTAFSSALAKDYNVNAHFALIDFKDITCDGKNSTKVVSDGYQNWYSDVNSFINSVKTLRATGGGDGPECDVDALETARRLDFRRTASKFIILITDESYKVANNYGIKSMDDEIELLKNDGIHVSVVTSSYYANTYKSLYEATGGIFANISSSSFSNSLLNLASQIGEETTDGTWVILKHGYRYIKLPEIPSHGSNTDTDGDGLMDYAELGKETTIDLSDFIKVQLAIKGIPFSEFSGKTSITVYDAASDPTLRDTDGDGIFDCRDTAPYNIGLKNGVIGSVQLIADTEKWGHAFIAFTSYVNDEITTSGSYYYSNADGSGETHFVDKRISFSANELLTFGLLQNGVLYGSSGSNSGSAVSGFHINGEIANGGATYYHTRYSIQKDVTKTQLNAIVNYFKNHDYYILSHHNCATVACGAWNSAFNDSLSANGFIGIDTPSKLKDSMDKKYGCTENMAMISPIELMCETCIASMD